MKPDCVHLYPSRLLEAFRDFEREKVDHLIVDVWIMQVWIIVSSDCLNTYVLCKYVLQYIVQIQWI